MKPLDVLRAIDTAADEMGWAYAGEVADEMAARGHGGLDGRTLRPWFTTLREQGLIETRMGNAGEVGYAALVYGLTERGGEVLAVARDASR